MAYMASEHAAGTATTVIAADAAYMAVVHQSLMQSILLGNFIALPPAMRPTFVGAPPPSHACPC